MLSITFASPSVPTLPIGLMPIAANPIASVEPPGASDDFASVIAGMDSGLMPDSPPLQPAPGTTLPPARRSIAGPPEPLPAIDVETVMVGSATSLPTIFAPPRLDPTSAGPQPASPDPLAQPAAPAAIQAWTLQTSSTLALGHAAPRPPGFEIRRLPSEVPAEVVEDAMPTPALDDKSSKLEPLPAEYPAEPALPAIPADPKLEIPALPAPVFLPTSWVQPPQVTEQPATAPSAAIEPPVSDRSAPALIAQPVGVTPSTVARPTRTPPDSPLPVTIEGVDSASGAPAQPIAPTPVAAPVFDLPPEVARQVAQLVQAFTTAPGDAPEPVPESSTPLNQPAPVAQSQPVFAAAPQIAAPVQLGFVDTIRAEWMQAMIERIGEFAQADGKREAQIRLTPDTLGTIDVKIVERHDRLHVTLTTDNAQTRQLLSDAAPRLHELAEARGLKLGQTGVGGGEPQDRRPTPEQPQTPLRPRPAPAAADSTRTSGDLIA